MKYNMDLFENHFDCLGPSPHEYGYFQIHSFFYAVWPFVHTQTLHQVTETGYSIVIKSVKPEILACDVGVCGFYRLLTWLYG